MKQLLSPGLDGKVALVTGGAKGIGRAAASLFSQAGAKVAVADLDVEAGEATAAAIRDRGGQAIFLRADVSVEADLEAMVATTVAHFGALDCAFNNAGLSGVHTAFHELGLADWERILAADLTSVFLCMKHELAHMVATGHGAIVNTASGAGFVPVCPGVTDTAMMQDFIGDNAELERMMLDTLPFGRMARAEEVAAAAVWLCSDAASFVSGESLLVDGASVCR